MNLLEVQNLSVDFIHNNSSSRVVKNLSFGIPKNTIVGIAGESGSGKTVTALSIIKLLDANAKFSSGSILWNEGQQSIDLMKLSEDQIRLYRGAKISMIFQEPMSALNPILTCGFQASESLLAHRFGTNFEIKQRILDCFQQVGLLDSKRIYDSYPFELSGGQLQRVLIAMAISCNPQLIIADEPTTALDVSIQKQIIELLQKLRVNLKLSILFISHDLGLIKDFCDEVIIMNQGQIVESGKTENIFNSPQHPYTQGLIHCRPPINYKVKRLLTLADFNDLKHVSNNAHENLEVSPEQTSIRLKNLDLQEEFLSVSNLNVQYSKSKGFLSTTKTIHKAVNEVSFNVRKGEVLGLVGESGSGKSTIGKAILNLIKSNSGSIRYGNIELTTLHEKEWRPLRRDLQIIFQDPYSALNPKQMAGDALVEPMKVHGLQGNLKQRKEFAIHLLETVGLNSNHYNRYPHQFSGGQRQRVCIARALSLQPKFIVCDEPVSSLDVSIQAQILNLLQELKEKLALSYLFISHDLSVVNFISDRIIVLKDGEIVEQGSCDEIIYHPKSDYTKSLLAAVPSGF